MHESEMNQRLKKSFPNGHKNASKHKHPPFWDEQLKSLFKEAKHAENSFCKSLANSTERQILRKEFKTKQDKFDKSFRKIKRSYIRQKEIRIENMISKNGRDIWKEIAKIGPPMKSNNIPEEIICPNGTITGNLVDVLNSWAKFFLQFIHRY